MWDLEWINIASKSLAYCAQLLQQNKQLKEKFETLQEEAAKLKTLVQKQEQLLQDLTERHGGYDTVYYNWNSCSKKYSLVNLPPTKNLYEP